jgi:hypothetical protein
LEKLYKIISGGQTGVDRAALDFAIESGIESGGFIPKNRRAEDGRLSERYRNLIETNSENSAERTELNVINSDATLILSRGNLSGGSQLTKELAEKYHKPFLHIDFSVLNIERAADETLNWMNSINCRILNVAGPRASEDDEIYTSTRLFLHKLFDEVI